MKIIKISMQLGVDNIEVDNPKIGLDNIVQYLNDKLYRDPEFFGDFVPENIEIITDEDGTLIYEKNYGWIK